MNEDKIFRILIKLAIKAYKKNEVPMAALILDENGRIISKAYNLRNLKNSTIAHAEILAIIKANKKAKCWKMNHYSLYSLLEPCDMCKSVIFESRISNVYYFLDRLPDKKQYSRTNIRRVGENNIKNQEEYRNLLQDFWKNKR